MVPSHQVTHSNHPHSPWDQTDRIFFIMSSSVEKRSRDFQSHFDVPLHREVEVGVNVNVMTPWLIQDHLRPSYIYESLGEVVKEDEDEDEDDNEIQGEEAEREDEAACRRQCHRQRMEMIRRQDFRSTADPDWDDNDIIL